MTTSDRPLGPAVLELDYDGEIERICARLREILSRELSRRGLVVAEPLYFRGTFNRPNHVRSRLANLQRE